MNENEMMGMLASVNAIIKDSHIVYTSGKHGSAYVNKDAVYPHTDFTSKLCQEMAERFKDENVDVVAGPTIGGVILSQWVAHFLSEITGRKVLGVFAEEDENKNRFFKRGYDKLVKEKNVLIVEDIITTGGSVKKVVEALNNLNANIVGCAALCNRGGVDASALGEISRFEALINVNFQSWEESECPLCKDNVPINTSVGKGREYLASKK